MLKKYLPYFALLGAGFLLWFIKKHQASSYPKPVNNRTEIILPAIKSDLPFNRDGQTILYNDAMRCRMQCLHINEKAVQEILAQGKLHQSEMAQTKDGQSFPLEGTTLQHQHLRIVFLPQSTDTLEAINCIDLEKAQACNCK